MRYRCCQADDQTFDCRAYPCVGLGVCAAAAYWTQSRRAKRKTGPMGLKDAVYGRLGAEFAAPLPGNITGWRHPKAGVASRGWASRRVERNPPKPQRYDHARHQHHGEQEER